MIPTHIPLWQWILSQVFAGLALITIAYAMQIKTKGKTLVVMCIFNFFMCIMAGLLLNWVLMGVYALAVVRDAIFLLREKKAPNSKFWAIFTLVGFLVVSVIISCFTIDWLNPVWWRLALNILLQLLALFIIYGAWAKGVHMIKISRLVFCSFAILNHILFYNYTAIAIETFSIISIIIFYIVFFRKSAEIKKEKHIDNAVV